MEDRNYDMYNFNTPRENYICSTNTEMDYNIIIELLEVIR